MTANIIKFKKKNKNIYNGIVIKKSDVVSQLRKVIDNILLKDKVKE